ncbi:MAG: hypothetical protein ABSH48_25490 [Verrucomicrobiota bacterium]|jgi:hypothetical protein
MNDEFYIGWEDKAAPGISRFVRRTVLLLLTVCLGGALVLAARQRTIGVSVFEWGTVKKFSGILQTQPYPHLLVPRPGAAGSTINFSTYYLVAPFKYGLGSEKLSALEGKTVSMKGTLIYRGNQTMVEAIPDSIKAADEQLPLLRGLETESLGRQTFVGEIVDSKCYLGVMNPGQLLPHRDCAILCISGGIPPVLLVRQKIGPPIYLLLASADNKPVNQQVLDLVAEPVQITGEVERQGDLLILRADPAHYQRVR